MKNQRLGILELANRHKWKVEFVEETASGTLSYRKRVLGDVIEGLQASDSFPNPCTALITSCTP